MGWWSFPEDSSVLLGDEALDATYDYLEKLAELYTEQFERKPTLSELQAALRLALRINGQATIEDLPEERQVDAVTIKTVARAKRQKYQVGDVFSIPLSDGRYAFGRIMNLSDGWDMVEVFAHVDGAPRFSPQVTKSRRLLPPILIDPRDVFGKGKWKIIQSDPDYTPSDLESQRFVMGTPRNYKWVEVNGFEPRGKLSDAEASKLPRWEMLTAEGAVEEIEEAARQQRLS